MALYERMKTCEQSSGQTILQHGESVSETFNEMYRSRSSSEKFHASKEIWDNLDDLLALCPSPEVMQMYHIFHDCGKPSCLVVDETGRRHFPGHETISSMEWLSAGGCPIIGRLIEHDMDFHRMKASDIESYQYMSIAAPLLLTAWAELNSNASMFGGIDSVSFKIKSKNLTKVTKLITQRVMKGHL